MKDFLYIFRDTLQNTEAYAKLSPAELEADMQQWNAWMSGLAESGKLVGGQPLLPEGYVVKGPSKKTTDGPYIEGKRYCWWISSHQGERSGRSDRNSRKVALPC